MISTVATSAPVSHAALSAVLLLATYASLAAVITDAVVSRPFSRVALFVVLMFAASAQMAAELDALDQGSRSAPEVPTPPLDPSESNRQGAGS